MRFFGQSLSHTKKPVLSVSLPNRNVSMHQLNIHMLMLLFVIWPTAHEAAQEIELFHSRMCHPVPPGVQTP